MVGNGQQKEKSTLTKKKYGDATEMLLQFSLRQALCRENIDLLFLASTLN